MFRRLVEDVVVSTTGNGPASAAALSGAASSSARSVSIRDVVASVFPREEIELVGDRRSVAEATRRPFRRRRARQPEGEAELSSMACAVQRLACEARRASATPLRIQLRREGKVVLLPPRRARRAARRRPRGAGLQLARCAARPSPARGPSAPSVRAVLLCSGPGPGVRHRRRRLLLADLVPARRLPPPRRAAERPHGSAARSTRRLGRGNDRTNEAAGHKATYTFAREHPAAASVWSLAGAARRDGRDQGLREAQGSLPA